MLLKYFSRREKQTTFAEIGALRVKRHNLHKRRYLRRSKFATRHALHIKVSVNDRVIFLFREDLHMRSFAKIKPSRKYPNLQYLRLKLSRDSLLATDRVAVKLRNIRTPNMLWLFSA